MSDRSHDPTPHRPARVLPRARRTPVWWLALAAVAIAGIVAAGTWWDRARIEDSRRLVRQRLGAALVAACSAGDTVQVRRLARRVSQADVRTPLVYGAACDGRADVLRALLEAGWSVEGTSSDGNPLNAAASWGRTAAAGVLLERGAAVDQADSLGMTALAWAAARGHADIARLLLARGASPTAQVRHPRESPKPPKAPRGINRPPNPTLGYKGTFMAPAFDYRSAPTSTPLMLAAAYGHAGVVRVLLKAGADAGARGSDGKTALDLAKEYGHPEVVHLLQRGGRTAHSVVTASRSGR